MNKLIPLFAVAGWVLALAGSALAATITDDVESAGDYTYKGASISNYDRPSGDFGVTSQAGARFMNTSGGNTTSRSGTFTFTPGGTNTGFGTGNLIQAGTYAFTMSVGDTTSTRSGLTTWSNRLQTTSGFLGGTAVGLNGATEFPGGVVTDLFVALPNDATAQWTTTTITYTVPAGDPLIGQQFTWAADYTFVAPVAGLQGAWDAVSIVFTPASAAITSKNFGVGRKPVYVLEGKIGLVRKWTSRKGAEVLAKLDSMKGDRVILYTSKRKQIAIKFDQLSREDQAYITEPLLTPSRSMIKPVAVTEDSGSYSKIASTARLIDSTGLAIALNTGDKIPDALPAFSGTYKEMWLSKSGAVEKQFIVFDLGGMFTVTDMYIWPYAMPNRKQISVKEVALFVAESDTSQGLSARRSNWKQVRGPAGNTFFFPAAEKAHPAANRVKLPSPFHARYIMLDILSNHSEKDTFVGMSKIRFAGWSLK